MRSRFALLRRSGAVGYGHSIVIARTVRTTENPNLKAWTTEMPFVWAEDSPELDLGTGDFSLSFWINWQADRWSSSVYPAAEFAEYRTIFSKEGAFEALLEYKGGTGDFLFRFDSPGFELTPLNIFRNKWIHITLTFDAATGTLRLYKDSEFFAQSTVDPSHLNESSSPLMIGSLRHVPSRSLNMSLDDWRIYNRVLSHSEIEQLQDPNHSSWDLNADLDGDGLTGLEEFQYGFSPTVAQGDFDGDGISDFLEIRGYEVGSDGIPFASDGSKAVKTDPRVADEDGDGLSDLLELQGVPGTVTLIDLNGDSSDDSAPIVTDPKSRDTDGDGLDDRLEREVYFTDPANKDTDGDGIDDGFEFANGLNPNDFSDGAGDLDGDEMSNVDEYRDPNRKVTVNEERLQLSSQDSDGDGLSDLEEIELGLDPHSIDSDGDTMSDLYEVTNDFDPLDNLDPANDLNPDDNATADFDGDGVSNADEEANETNPKDWEDKTIVVRSARGISKTKEVSANASPEEKVDEFYHRSFRVLYPKGSSFSPVLAGDSPKSPFGVLEGLILGGTGADGSEKTIEIPAAGIENSFTSSDEGNPLPPSSFIPARGIGRFLDSLKRDEEGYVRFSITFVSTANDKEGDDEVDQDPKPPVGMGPGGPGGGGSGGGGGFGGGGGGGWLSGLGPWGVPWPDSEPEPEKEKEESFKAKANSLVMIYGLEDESCGESGSSSSVRNSSVDVRIGLGQPIRGSDPGSLFIESDLPSEDLYSPESVNFVTDVYSNVSIVRDGPALRQIATERALVDLVVLDSFSYEISFYDRSLFGEPDESGLFDTSTEDPFKVWTFEDPDAGSGNFHRLKVSESVGTEVTEYLYTWIPANQGWTLNSAGLKETGRSEVVSGNLRTETLWESIPGGAESFREETVYEEFPWGEEKVSRTLDPDSLDGGLATNWTYYEDPVADGVNYRRLKLVEYPDGGWIRYEYDSSGRVTKEVRPVGNAAPTDPESSCRVLERSFQAEAPQVTEVETALGVETSRVYTVRQQGSTARIEAVSPGVVWTDPSNILTETTIVGGAGEFSARTAAVFRPDGTATLYSYDRDSSGSLTVVTDNGVYDMGAGTVVDGTRNIRQTDSFGNLLGETTEDIVSSEILSLTTVLETDADGRPTLIGFLDGTTESRTYTGLDCGCGPDKLETEVDRRGIATGYTYDGLGRKKTQTRLGITEEYFYDGSGRIIRVEQTAGGSTRTVGETKYDLAGRIKERESPGPRTDGVLLLTSYDYDFPSGGGETETVTNPDGSTSLRTSYRDGSTMRTGGTAGSGQRFEYRAETGAFVTRTILLDSAGADTAEWTEEWRVMGRVDKRVYGDQAEEQFFYDAIGRLDATVDPDGVTVLYGYNEKGEQYQQAVDMDRDGTIDDLVSELDRVSETVSSITTRTYEGQTYDVRRTESFVWTDEERILVSISDGGLDGLRQWSERFGQTTYTEIVDPDDTDGAWQQITVQPDGSRVVETYTNGRPASTVWFDSVDVQLASNSVLYDEWGRPEISTDSRTGTTIYAYYDNDQVRQVTEPDPDGISGPLSALVTVYEYDYMGRLTTTTLPDSSTVHVTYTPKGEIEKRYGSQTVPVEYTYDAQGRRQTMTTWQDFNPSTGMGVSGAAVTTWIYDPQRGWLDRKEYDDGNGTDYTYTAAGRLETRTWDRGVVTTYGYDNAGGQDSVDYSDATPDISYTYTRTGQPKTVTDATGTRTFDYDETDLRLDTETLPAGFYGDLVLSREYQDGSEPNGVPGRPDGYQLLDDGTPASMAAYTFDAAGRLETVSDGTDTFTYHYLGGSANLLESVEGPAHTAHYMYESGRNNVTVVENEETVGMASTVSRFTYRYNELGQRTDRVDEGSAFSQAALFDWSYDGLGQVTAAARYLGTNPDNPGASVPAQDAEFDYDFIGNRLASTFGTASQRSYTADSLNQYTGITNPSAGPSYDEDGNMNFDGEGWYFEWNGENRMIEARNYADAMNPASGSVRLTFAYDYQGRRVEKSVEEYDTQLASMQTVSEERFAYDGWNLIATFDSQVLGLSLQDSYLWGLDFSGSMQGAGGVGGLLSVSEDASNESYYPTYDANGNVSEYIDETGAIAAHYEYSSFGRVIASTGSPDDFAFRFSTKYQDDDTGLLYYGFRYYVPETGRWPSRDPIGERGGFNLYVFVGNDVVNYFDRFGLAIFKKNISKTRDRLYINGKPAWGRTDFPYVSSEKSAEIKEDEDVGLWFVTKKPILTIAVDIVVTAKGKQNYKMLVEYKDENYKARVYVGGDLADFIKAHENRRAEIWEKYVIPYFEREYEEKVFDLYACSEEKLKKMIADRKALAVEGWTSSSEFRSAAIEQVKFGLSDTYSESESIGKSFFRGVYVEFN